MSDFLTYVPPPAPKDTTKRVRYRTGLVLGEEEFQQEQAYFIERDRRHQRALHGYGTVCGLAVDVRDTSEGPEVFVGPGLAVNPAGETILVPSAQCAALNAWLRSHRTAIDGLFGSPPATLTLDIQLCHRPCDTDPKPVPGGPCRTQDELMQASRTQDDFELRLKVFDPTSPLGSPPTSPVAAPSFPEHLAVRALGDIFASIVVDPSGPHAAPTDLSAWVREIATGLGSPPVVSSPPAPPRPSVIRLDPATAEEAIRSALLVWVTEVRPLLASGCSLAPPDAPCVSLGHIVLALDASGEVPDRSAVTIDGTARPFLLGTEVLQEWSLAGMVSPGAAFSSVGSPPDAAPMALGGDVVGPVGANTVRALQGDGVRAGATDGDVMVFDGGASEWVPGPPSFVQVEGGAYRVVAAGMFRETGSPLGAVFGRPTVTRRGTTAEYDVTFPGYVAPSPGGRTMLLVRGVVGAGALPGLVALGDFGSASFRVLVQDVRGSPANRPFQLEIVEYTT